MNEEQKIEVKLLENKRRYILLQKQTVNGELKVGHYCYMLEMRIQNHSYVCQLQSEYKLCLEN